MATVVLVIHLMVAAALVAVVLLQRSEGGALGIGGGGGLMTGRGTANLLTRVTAVLAAMFFFTSVSLTLLARRGTAPTSIIDSGSPSAPLSPGGGGGGGGILDQLKAGGAPKPAGPQVPQSQ